MTNPRKKEPLYFSLGYRTGDGYGNFRIRVVQASDRLGEYETANETEWLGDPKFNDFEVSGQWNTPGGLLTREDELTGQVYGYGVGYRDMYSVNLRDLEPKVKFLRKIERGLRKIQDDFGHARDLDDYIRRVAKVLKIKGAVIRDEHTKTWERVSIDTLLWKMAKIVADTLPKKNEEVKA